jgi:DNA gyrase/topoisomerase IV subunit A
MRLVIEVGKGQNAQAIAQEMYGKPELGLQRNYNFNMVAIIDGKPVLASLKMLLETFVNHKKETFIRRLKYELNKAESRVHILEGLLLAVAEIEKIVRLIKKSKSPKDAKKALMTNFPLSEIQAQAILDLKLQQRSRKSKISFHLRRK